MWISNSAIDSLDDYEGNPVIYQVEDTMWISKTALKIIKEN